MLGKAEGRRRRVRQKMRWLDGIIDSMDANLGKLWEMVRERKAWHAAVPGITKSQTQCVTEQQQGIKISEGCQSLKVQKLESWHTVPSLHGK